jgi:nucleoid-associated protein YejK
VYLKYPKTTTYLNLLIMKSETFSAKFKTQVVLELLRDFCSLGTLSNKYSLEEQQVIRWKNEFLDAAENIIIIRQAKNLNKIKKKRSIREIKLKNDFLGKVLK